MSSSIIESSSLKVRVSSLGAELTEVKSTRLEHNWIWSAGPSWARSAPILFPIVGRLKNDQFLHKNVSYSLTQHGFARDSDFQLVESAKSHVHYRLRADENTIAKFPFQFQLDITYTVNDNLLSMSVSVQNLSTEDMYFNFGWHPGFVLPNSNKDSLIFSSQNSMCAPNLLSSGLLSEKMVDSISGLKSLVLSSATFANDALVFAGSSLNKVSLAAGTRRVEIDLNGAPHFGLWTKNIADFVCLEPWWGYADSGSVSGVLSEKPSVQVLKAGSKWEWHPSVRFIETAQKVEDDKIEN